MHTRTLFGPCAALLFAALAAAQSLTGIVASPQGAPIAGVTITLNNNGGTRVTNALGAFTFSPLQNRIYTATVLPPAAWAPRLLTITVQGVTNMGTLVLQPGVQVSGTAHGPTGLPLANANVDAIDANDVTLFTPNDGTDVNGNFAVTVPLGVTKVRVNPPTGQLLVRYETTIDITVPVNLGVITLAQAFNVSGVVVDSNSGLPISGVTVAAFDNRTLAPFSEVNPTTGTLGNFTLQLPIGVHRLEFDPPTGNAHAASVKHSVLVLSTTNLGTIGLKPAITLTGTVSGPGGPVTNCDVDVETTEGMKMFTLHDNTNASGVFSIRVPAGTYRFRVDPPPTSGLYGTRTGTQAFAVSTTVPPIALQAGVSLQLDVSGPNGPEVNADLDFFDVATGAPIIIVGDKSNAAGAIHATVPTGLFDVALDAAQGSTAAPLRVQSAIAGPQATQVVLAQKQAVVDLHPSYGIQSIGQGGTLFVDARLRNLTPATIPMLLEVSIRFPSGAEQLVGVLPLDLFASFDFSLTQFEVTLPPVPASEVGKDLRCYVRMRNPDQTLLDQAYVEFVVE